MVLVARGVLGEFHLLVPVRSPLTAETALGVSLVLSLALSTGIARTKAPKASWIALLAVLAVVGLCFAGSLGNYFVGDDFLVLDYGRRFTPQQVGSVLTASTSGGAFFRPVGIFLWVMETKWFGLWPWGWHALGLALHLINCVLVYLLGKSLFASQRAAVWATVFFGLNPASPEAVSWPGGGQDTLLVTMFVLATCVLFVRYTRTRSAGTLIASLVTLLFALLSKETGYVLPALLGLIALHQSVSLKSTIPHWIVMAAAFLYRALVLRGVGGYPDVHVTVVGATKALLLRLWAVLAFPINWSSRFEFYLMAGLALGIVGYLAVMFSHPSRRDVLFALAWVVLCAAPGIQMLLVGADLLNSRLLYASLPGFAFLLACAARATPRLSLAAALAITLFYAAALQHNLEIRARVSGIARQTCAAAAQGATAAEPPRVVDGVWLFATGFRECVELQKEAVQ